MLSHLFIRVVSGLKHLRSLIFSIYLTCVSPHTYASDNINSVVKLELVCTIVLVCSHDPTNCLRTNYNLGILNAKNLEPCSIYIFSGIKLLNFIVIQIISPCSKIIFVTNIRMLRNAMEFIGTFLVKLSKC